MHASILKGTSLLPYVHSGTKFEQMLQEMLHREVKKDDKIESDGGTEREGKMICNGNESWTSPDRRTAVTSEDMGVSGVTCRWCSQPFPNGVVLLQHERCLCKTNPEAVEVPDHPSRALHLGRPDVKAENRKQSELTLSLPRSKSPGWPSPQAQQVSWSQDSGSREQQMNCSPERSSPGGRGTVPSSQRGSPAGLNLTYDPPEHGSPQRGSPWSQSEPLDLSLPKQHSDQVEKSKFANGNSGLEERRELKRPSPTARLALHHRPVYSGAGASVFSGFPLFSQSALGISGHDGITAVPFSPPAHGTGCFPPLAYMMEADPEAALKKIHQERQALMVSHGFKAANPVKNTNSYDMREQEICSISTVKPVPAVSAGWGVKPRSPGLPVSNGWRARWRRRTGEEAAEENRRGALRLRHMWKKLSEKQLAAKTQIRAHRFEPSRTHYTQPKRHAAVLWSTFSGWLWK